MAKMLQFFCLLLLGCALSACLDLSGAGTAKERKAAYKAAHVHNNYKREIEVHTMLGGLGLFSKGMYKLRNSVAERYQVPSDTIIWYKAGDLTKEIVHNYYAHVPHRPIILVGHSLGANEQIKVARNLDSLGIPVDLLVTVDTVSQTVIPPNVKLALNLYKPWYVPMFSGLEIKAEDPKKTRIENVNVDELKQISVNHFTIDKDDGVQDIILAEIGKVLRNANS